MEEAINQRVNKLIEYYTGGNKSKFARQIEVGIGSINSVVGKQQSIPRVETIESILRYYPEINRDWIYNGKGEMIKDMAKEVPAEKMETTSSMNELIQMLKEELARYRKREDIFMDQLGKFSGRGDGLVRLSVA